MKLIQCQKIKTLVFHAGYNDLWAEISAVIVTLTLTILLM